MYSLIYSGKTDSTVITAIAFASDCFFASSSSILLLRRIEEQRHCQVLSTVERELHLA